MVSISREISPSWVSARERTLFVGGMTALLLLGAVFRLYALGGQAFDCDELYVLRIEGGSLKEIGALFGRSAFHDFHPPVSYLLFMLWIALFGAGEAAVRSLPALLGLVSIALLGLAGRRIGGVWVGLAGAAFLAVNPLHIAYSQEARPYALAVTLTIAAHLLFLRSLGEASAGNRVAYALVCAAAIYTHYYVLFALLPHGLIALWLLWAGDEDSRRAARPTLLAYACAMATFIAWLPAVLYQVSGKTGEMSPRVLDLGESPLVRAGFYLKDAAGLGASPFLLPATLALLGLLAFAFTGRERLPAAPAESDSGGLPTRRMGAGVLLAGILLAAGLPLLAPRLLFPAAREVLRAEGYGGAAIEGQLHALLGFTVSLPAAVGVIGLLVLGWPWLSSLPGRLPWRPAGQSRPLTVRALLAALLLLPVGVVLVLGLGGLPLLAVQYLLAFEPALALALGVGAVRLARVRWGRLALAPAVLCIALAGLQYQPVSGIFGVRGIPLGRQTGAWRDLVRELDRHGGNGLPLVLVDNSRSDPAELYLRDRPMMRIPESGSAASLPEDFRFVHLVGYPSSEVLLGNLSRAVSLEPRFRVDEFVIYEAHRKM
ncbi:MAG TPA: glycosyltransferase family 39 protein [Thermoanaerobaculia bacterium]|nr:glycosyltransferase family 39 protein [Thermoanaerobaculia bacterium]